MPFVRPATRSSSHGSSGEPQRLRGAGGWVRARGARAGRGAGVRAAPRGCPACKAGVRELEELSGRLAYAVAPVEPPASLRAAIRRRTGLTVRRRMARVVGSWSGARVAVRAVAVAGVAALFALSLWNLALREQHQL